MKKLIALSVLAATLSMAPAHAVDPVEVVTAVGVGMAAAGVVVIAATVTGNQEALCSKMGGTFTPAPAGQDVCPGGSWANLFTGKRPK